MSARMASSSTPRLYIGIREMGECLDISYRHRSAFHIAVPVANLRYRNLRGRKLPAGKHQTSRTQSPDAAETQV